MAILTDLTMVGLEPEAQVTAAIGVIRAAAEAMAKEVNLAELFRYAEGSDRYLAQGALELIRRYQETT